ncbi:MAG: ATP-binding protein [Chloroflexota bacterium]
MITLADFFALNREIILFVYGLVFFILGFAIILQTRQSSRLDLARNLRWLAAFGLLHGFYEWGDLFIPIQADYLSETTIQVLYYLHKVLLAASFVCLFEFGLSVLPSNHQRRGIHWQSIFLFVLWILIVSFVLLQGHMDFSLWRRTSNALARYFIGFPGGMLAAYGLRAHTLQRIKPLDVPKIVQMFRIAGLSLGIYAVVGGLIPPPVNFLPGSIVNTETFTEFVGAPPLVFRSLVGMIVAFTLIRALEIFDLETERRIERLEQQQIINAEQERLARELHDGAIQKVYTAGLLVESAARIAEPDSELDKRLKRAVGVLSDSILDLRRNLSELHAHARASEEPLPELLQKIAENPNYNTMVHISVETDLPAEKSVSAKRASHIFAIVNEALANTVRHAHATRVKINALDLGENFRIVIRDDGTGMPADKKNGYGLRNMSDRARLLNGSIEFENDKGTVVALTVPWND